MPSVLDRGRHSERGDHPDLAGRVRDAANKLLGQFSLIAIRQRPRSVPQIEVSYTLDQNGIFTVQAKDRAIGKDQQVRDQPSRDNI